MACYEFAMLLLISFLLPVDARQLYSSQTPNEGLLEQRPAKAINMNQLLIHDPDPFNWGGDCAAAHAAQDYTQFVDKFLASSRAIGTGPTINLRYEDNGTYVDMKASYSSYSYLDAYCNAVGWIGQKAEASTRRLVSNFSLWSALGENDCKRWTDEYTNDNFSYTEQKLQEDMIAAAEEGKPAPNKNALLQNHANDCYASAPVPGLGACIIALCSLGHCYLEKPVDGQPLVVGHGSECEL